MNPLAQRVAGIVSQSAPDLLCFTCLAREQGLPEHDVRAAALVLITRAGFQLSQRVCSSCRRLDELLSVERAA
jgi:hypothetical protein